MLGTKCHSLFWSKDGNSTPLGIKTLDEFMAISFNGLWIPSKIVSNIPGPSSTDNGFPVLKIGSPYVRPDVSS